MNTHQISFMKYFLLIFLPLVISIDSGAQKNETFPVKDENAILKVLSSFTDAWNKHDAKAFASIFSEDVDFINVAGKSAQGRNEIEKHHEPGFKTKWKESFQKFTKHKIRFIRPDVASVNAWWELTGIKGPEGQDMPPRKGILSFIMTRTGEVWLITVMHNMELRDPQ